MVSQLLEAVLKSGTSLLFSLPFGASKVIGLPQLLDAINLPLPLYLSISVPFLTSFYRLNDVCRVTHFVSNEFLWGTEQIFKSIIVYHLTISNGMQARIDSHNKILYARHADQRNATFQRVLQSGSEFDREVRSMLLRANLIKHDYNQRGGSRKIWYFLIIGLYTPLVSLLDWLSLLWPWVPFA